MPLVYFIYWSPNILLQIFSIFGRIRTNQNPAVISMTYWSARRVDLTICYVRRVVGLVALFFLQKICNMRLCSPSKGSKHATCSHVVSNLALWKPWFLIQLKGSGCLSIVLGLFKTSVIVVYALFSGLYPI